MNLNVVGMIRRGNRLGCCTTGAAAAAHPAELGVGRDEGADRLARAATAVAAGWAAGRGRGPADPPAECRACRSPSPMSPRAPMLDWSDAGLVEAVLDRHRGRRAAAPAPSSSRSTPMSAPIPPMGEAVIAALAAPRLAPFRRSKSSTATPWSAT